MCSWNAATYKWKIPNGKIDIIFVVVRFRSVHYPLSSLIFRIRSRYEADLTISVHPFLQDQWDRYDEHIH